MGTGVAQPPAVKARHSTVSSAQPGNPGVTVFDSPNVPGRPDRRTSSSGRRRPLLLAATLLAVVVLVVGLVMLAPPDQPTPTTIANASPGQTNPAPTRQAPKSAARRVHRALHAIGRICKPGDTVNRTAQVRPHVQTVLDFALQYGEVSFSIDDEQGTTVSALVVVRFSVRTCSPTLAERANQALPAAYRLSDATSGPS